MEKKLTICDDRNLALLRAAVKYGPAVKSIAVTGSINAATTGSPEELGAPLTPETWLPISREKAREINNAYISYCSGKKEGELAIWDFVKTQSPKFAVTVFLPALIFGPPIEPVKGGAKGLHYSAGVIYSLFNGTYETIPATTFPSYIDVRDLADAHVKSLTEPAVANKRLTIGGQSMTYTALVHSLAKVPELAGRVPADSGEDQKVTPAIVDAHEGNELLKMTLRSLDETMADTAKRILELEQQA
jgi:nucleoside-diphosphate-sugar epimerase